MVISSARVRITSPDTGRQLRSQLSLHIHSQHSTAFLAALIGSLPPGSHSRTELIGVDAPYCSVAPT